MPILFFGGAPYCNYGRIYSETLFQLLLRPLYEAGRSGKATRWQVVPSRTVATARMGYQMRLRHGSRGERPDRHRAGLPDEEDGLKCYEPGETWTGRPRTGEMKPSTRSTDSKNSNRIQAEASLQSSIRRSFECLLTLTLAIPDLCLNLNRCNKGLHSKM